LANKGRTTSLDFEVDKLTNSIENVFSGDCFPPEISLVSAKDIKSVGKKHGWQFDWKHEFKQSDREVYKLTITGNGAVIQGLICLEIRADHIFMHLLEAAPFNKGKDKLYSGVPGNLVAFACRMSFQRGFEENVCFVSKTQLIDHYVLTLGALHFGGRIMIIETLAALKLINRYFKS
jgi:hypothetical protein